jgi:hypothetical protein
MVECFIPIREKALAVVWTDMKMSRNPADNEKLAEFVSFFIPFFIPKPEIFEKIETWFLLRD